MPPPHPRPPRPSHDDTIIEQVSRLCVIACRIALQHGGRGEKDIVKPPRATRLPASPGQSTSRSRSPGGPCQRLFWPLIATNFVSGASCEPTHPRRQVAYLCLSWDRDTFAHTRVQSCHHAPLPFTCCRRTPRRAPAAPGESCTPCALYCDRLRHLSLPWHHACRAALVVPC